MSQNRGRGSSSGSSGGTGVVSSGAVGTTIGGSSNRSISRVADAVTAMSGKDSVRMLMGVTSGTLGDVAVGGSVFRVRNWVNQPAVAGAKVGLLMQGGWMIGLGLTATAAAMTQDTGLLDVTALRGADWADGEVYVQRVDREVRVTTYGLATPGNKWFVPALEYPVPDGFTPAQADAWTVLAPVWDGDTGGVLTTTLMMPANDAGYGWISMLQYIGGTKVYGTLTYQTDDAWPAVMPGPPAAVANLGRPPLKAGEGRSEDRPSAGEPALTHHTTPSPAMPRRTEASPDDSSIEGGA